MTTLIPKVLILSSTVSCSRVGTSTASFCLRRLGIEAIVIATTVFGRHPGWGNPGGGPVEAAVLRDVWDAIKAQDIQFDGVLTGYMGQTDHIQLGGDIISHVKSTNPKAIIAVDPVMGDHGRLYIPEARAKALIDHLVPAADFITPNIWELEYIQTQLERLPPCLVTSVTADENIGAMWQERETRWQVSHAKFDSVPHGGGDSLAALFLGRRLLGETPKAALAKSVASIFEIMRAANALDSGELPLVRMQAFINDAIPLEVYS